jgi:hypothetical protein
MLSDTKSIAYRHKTGMHSVSRGTLAAPFSVAYRLLSSFIRPLSHGQRFLNKTGRLSSFEGMDLKLSGPPGGSGLWETVRVATQGGWSTTFKLGFLLLLLYLLGSGAMHDAAHLVDSAIASALHKH